MPADKEKVLVSVCLAGCTCRYDDKDNGSEGESDSGTKQEDKMHDKN